MPCLSLHSPLGALTLCEEGESLLSLDWRWTGPSDETGLLALACDQLREYFAGRRKSFSLPLAPRGTDFQRRVWALMRDIPFGEVRSYGDLARQLHTAPRAVGTACARNPLPIFIPCHRVVGSGGSLTGYSAGEGLISKRFLLDLERDGPRLF